LFPLVQTAETGVLAVKRPDTLHQETLKDGSASVADDQRMAQHLPLWVELGLLHRTIKTAASQGRHLPSSLQS